MWRLDFKVKKWPPNWLKGYPDGKSLTLTSLHWIDVTIVLAITSV